MKNKKSWLPPKHDVGGYRQRNFHGVFSEIGKCPKKMGVDGSFYLFVRGTAGAYVGGQINIQNTWNVREHIGIGKLSFETSVAYGVYGISIEVGAGLKATGLYRLR